MVVIDNYVMVYNADEVSVVSENINPNYQIIDCMDEDSIDNFLEKKAINYFEDGVIMFNLDNFINKNFKSYNYDMNSVWDQFKADSPRITLLVNKTKVDTPEKFKKQLNKLTNTSVKINKNIHKLIDIVAMLCNQSSFALSFKFLLKAHMQTDLKNREDIYVVGSSSNRSIKVNFNNKTKELNIIMETAYNLTNIAENKVISKINSIIVIDGLIKDNICNFNNNGLLLTTKL
jgi:hypothetical protein